MIPVEIISISGPYDFEQILNSHSFDPLIVLNKDERWIKVPLVMEGSPHVIKVQGVGTIDEPKFFVEGAEGNRKEAILKRLAHIFQWNVSLKEVYHHFSKTPLKPLFDEHWGTPLILDFNLFDCLVKCIIHQQLNTPFARILTERFVKTFGYERDGVFFYPSPEKVANLTVADLRKLQFSERKGEYVIGIARKVVEGKLNLEKLREKTDDEIFEEMLKLKGVGPWTVENFLILGLGKPNLFPVADIGLQKAIQKLFQLKERPTRQEMLAYKEEWSPYGSYASIYLWKTVD